MWTKLLPHPEDTEPQFADESGLFRKGKKRIRKIDHIEQIDEMDCGAASLAMVCRHFGREVSLARIRQLCHTSRDGTSLKAICHAATELGLAARALKFRCATSINAVARDRALGRQPLDGALRCREYLREDRRSRARARKVPRAEFETKWSGYAALFDYTTAFEQAPEATRDRLDLPFLLGDIAFSLRRCSCSRSLLPVSTLPDLHTDGRRPGHCRE